jgi:hypothetical protein
MERMLRLKKMKKENTDIEEALLKRKYKFKRDG